MASEVAEQFLALPSQQLLEARDFVVARFDLRPQRRGSLVLLRERAAHARLDLGDGLGFALLRARGLLALLLLRGREGLRQALHLVAGALGVGLRRGERGGLVLRVELLHARELRQHGRQLRLRRGGVLRLGHRPCLHVQELRLEARLRGLAVLAVLRGVAQVGPELRAHGLRRSHFARGLRRALARLLLELELLRQVLLPELAHELLELHVALLRQADAQGLLLGRVLGGDLLAHVRLPLGLLRGELLLQSLELGRVGALHRLRLLLRGAQALRPALGLLQAYLVAGARLVRAVLRALLLELALERLALRCSLVALLRELRQGLLVLLPRL